MLARRPGSGILHASMHDTFNSMPGVKCYSIFPSKVRGRGRVGKGNGVSTNWVTAKFSCF